MYRASTYSGRELCHGRSRTAAGGAAGAFWLLYENTEQRFGRLSRAGHVLFRQPAEYLAAFPGVEAAAHFRVEKERHTLFAGRLADTRQRS
jgi:hypothetical protein